MRIVSGLAVRQRAGQRFTNKGWNPPYGANRLPNGAKRIAAAQPIDLSLRDGLPSKHHVLDVQVAVEHHGIGLITRSNGAEFAVKAPRRGPD